MVLTVSLTHVLTTRESEYGETLTDSERASAFDTPFDSSRYEPPGTRTGLPDIATVDLEWI